MIGCWGFQIVEPPRASSGPARIQRSLAAENSASIAIENTRPVRIVPPRHSRSPPGLPGAGRHQPSRYGAGPAEATASPGEPISTRIDYGTESVVTSHITPARSQCKSPISRSSCGIAQTDGAVSAIRASEVGP
jgi:hypothetical protein